MSASRRSNFPLNGFRVLDLADEKADFCSKLLADLGATVTKIERSSGIGANQARNLTFQYHNAGKRFLNLDIETCAGRAVFRRLAKEADTVVETYPPGYLEELGVGYRRLVQKNPGLILASLTGFGQNGPKRDFPANDLVISAESGQMAVTGPPSMPPLKPRGCQTYYTASLYGAIGILLASLKRKKTGRGEHLDISLQETAISTLEHVLVRYFYGGTVAYREDGLQWNRAFCILECLDGWIVLAPLQQWETLIEWMNSENMAGDLTDEKWSDPDYRLSHFDDIRSVLEKWTRMHTRTDLFETGQVMGFPWGPVRSIREVLDCPQLDARDFWRHESSGPDGASLRWPGLPFGWRTSQMQPGRTSQLGEENVLAPYGELGFSQRPPKKLKVKNVKDGGDVVAKGPLNGIRVLDFTWVVAGPFATRILADFGAEVIKVQSNLVVGTPVSQADGFFRVFNRNKRSITLNMNHPESWEIIRRLTALSDVVMENFSPRVMSNWGLTYERLVEVRPDLIMASLSAMGRTGPWENYVAFAPIIHALSGLTHLTAWPDGQPAGPGYPYADAVAGLYATLAVLAALEERDRNGGGRYIDLSELESVCALMGPEFLADSRREKAPQPLGNQVEDSIAVPHGCYPCRGDDRWCVLSVFDDRQWQALSEVMRAPIWMANPLFATRSARKVNQLALDEALAGETRHFEAEELVQALRKAGVTAGLVRSIDDLAHDPHLRERGFFVSLEYPGYAAAVVDASPIRFLSGGPIQMKPAPKLGEDNKYVFSNLLGLSDIQIQSWMEKGIIY